MTVKEMISTYYHLPTPNYEFMVKPKGSDRRYYHGNGDMRYMFPQIRTKEITNWLIDVKQKRIVLIVEQDEEFEKMRDEAWENLRRNQNEMFKMRKRIN